LTKSITRKSISSLKKTNKGTLQHKKLNMTTSKKGKPHGGETWELVAGE
jgi:hypothetical protein